MRLLLLFLFIVCVQGCGSLLQTMYFGPIDVTLNEHIDQTRYKRIAVLPYDISGYNGMGMDKVSGTALADRYTNELMKIGYDVIERHRLENILEEHELSLSGLTDHKTGIDIGKVIGIQGIVLGSISGRPNAFSVMSKLVDVETGSIVWSIVISNNIEKNAIQKLKKTFDEQSNPN